MAVAPMAEAQPIRVNGREIGEADIAREMQHHPAESLAAARAQAIEALILQRLLIEEATRQGIAGPDGVDVAEDLGDDPRIAALVERAVRIPDPDEAACRRFYENNRAKFRAADEYEARHILIACAPDDFAARDGAKARAERLIATLQAQPDLFGSLAVAHSACPSRNQGGGLGVLTRGDTVPEFETYVFSLEEGELCPLPIETRFGVHVIALDRKLIGEALPYEAVRSRIARYLRDRSFHTATRQYLMLLAGQARIEGFDIAGADSFLVQ
jgi:peptidyl-prolyl cis-trans isomerase C